MRGPRPGMVACAVVATVACASAPPPAPAPPPPDASASWRTVRFGHGRGEVSLPPRYEAHVNDQGGLESVTNDPPAVVHLHLFIDIHPLEEVAPEATVPGTCPAFLRDRARDKGLGVGEHGDKVVLIEPGIRDVVEGAVVNNTHFQICAGGALFVMTLVVRESDADTPEAKEFFDAELEPIIASLRLR